MYGLGYDYKDAIAKKLSGSFLLFILENNMQNRWKADQLPHRIHQNYHFKICISNS